MLSPKQTYERQRRESHEREDAEKRELAAGPRDAVALIQLRSSDFRERRLNTAFRRRSGGHHQSRGVQVRRIALAAASLRCGRARRLRRFLDVTLDHQGSHHDDGAVDDAASDDGHSDGDDTSDSCARRAPARGESAATGDIPDNQVFLVFHNAAAGYSIRYPEGWAQSGSGGTTSFRDKNNIVRIVGRPGSSADARHRVASERRKPRRRPTSTSAPSASASRPSRQSRSSTRPRARRTR